MDHIRNEWDTVNRRMKALSNHWKKMFGFVEGDFTEYRRECSKKEVHPYYGRPVAGVGDYNPDWAIAFEEGKVKHVYFVAETKGTLSTMHLRKVEDAKLDCARRFFRDLNRDLAPECVRYEVVDSFARLTEVMVG